MSKEFLFALAVFLAAAAGMAAQELPYDPELRKGVLDNGMTYYIRHNAKPEGQAEFWIVHNVGAVQEEDSQQGLAHFLEQMAFNGTEQDRKSTRLNSSHVSISYAVFCLKKKKRCSTNT